MDKAISNLSVPLGQLKEEILVGFWDFCVIIPVMDILE